jgi:hypothetical protein
MRIIYCWWKVIRLFFNCRWLCSIPLYIIESTKSRLVFSKHTLKLKRRLKLNSSLWDSILLHLVHIRRISSALSILTNLRVFILPKKVYKEWNCGNFVKQEMQKRKSGWSWLFWIGEKFDQGRTCSIGDIFVRPAEEKDKFGV